MEEDENMDIGDDENIKKKKNETNSEDNDKVWREEDEEEIDKETGLRNKN